jgi:hypothetical protein
MASRHGGGATIRGKQVSVQEGQFLQFLRSVGYKDELPPSTVAWLETAPVFRFLASKLSHDNFITQEEEQEYNELMLARGPDASLYDAVDGLGSDVDLDGSSSCTGSKQGRKQSSTFLGEPSDEEVVRMLEVSGSGSWLLCCCNLHSWCAWPVIVLQATVLQALQACSGNSRHVTAAEHRPLHLLHHSPPCFGTNHAHLCAQYCCTHGTLMPSHNSVTHASTLCSAYTGRGGIQSAAGAAGSCPAGSNRHAGGNHTAAGRVAGSHAFYAVSKCRCATISTVASSQPLITTGCNAMDHTCVSYPSLQQHMNTAAEMGLYHVILLVCVLARPFLLLMSQIRLAAAHQCTSIAHNLHHHHALVPRLPPFALVLQLTSCLLPSWMHSSCQSPLMQSCTAWSQCAVSSAAWQGSRTCGCCAQQIKVVISTQMTASTHSMSGK